MKTKTLIPFHMLIIASLACNTIQGVIPETVSVDQSSPQAPQTVEIASPTAAPSIEAEAPQTPANNPLAAHISYPIVDSGQIYCYDDSGGSQPCPASGSAFYGQDAQYSGYAPSYTDNGDGTISDNVTGLIWQADPGAKMSYAQAVAGADSFTVAGYDDWRLPTIKELYSLILFSGYDVSGVQSDSDTSRLIPFIDDSFAFEYGDTSAGQRIIDSQWATSSIYTDMVFGRQEAMFGVNFADGRIKGYPTSGGQNMGYFVIYVRGNPAYGINDFVDNGNPSTGSGQVGTISDHATGLTWTQDDSGSSTGSEQGGMDWQAALNYCASQIGRAHV